MRVTVYFFAALADRVGERERVLQISDQTTVEKLYEQLFAGGHERLPVMFAVNQEYVSGDHLLGDGDEVAFIPPLGGG